MKKIVILLLTVLAVVGCGSKKSLKVTDPAERAAMRTRVDSCSVREAFGAKGCKIAFNVVSQVKPKAFVADYKEALSLSTETKSMEKVKGAFATVKETKSGIYNPGLTIYCTVMLIAFVLIVLGKVVFALIHND